MSLRNLAHFASNCAVNSWWMKVRCSIKECHVKNWIRAISGPSLYVLFLDWQMQLMHFKDPLTKLHVQIFTIGQRTAYSSFVLAFLSLANPLISWLLVKAFPSLYSCAGYAKMWCSLWLRVSASIFQNIQFLSKCRFCSQRCACFCLLT